MSEQSGDGAPSGQGGRRETSLGGLVGAMLVIVALVVVVVLGRNLVFGDDVIDETGRPMDLENLPAVDYLDSVQSLQLNGFDVVYPQSLPDGWVATQIDARPGEALTFRINLRTPDAKFVGLREEDEDVDDLLETYVDENVDEEDPLTDVGTVSLTWEGWSDAGGDHAYSAELGERNVIVFGDVPPEQLAELVGLLTTDPVPTPSPAPAPSPGTPSPS